MKMRPAIALLAGFLLLLTVPGQAQQTDAVDNTARQGVGNLNTAIEDLRSRVQALEDQLSAEIGNRAGGDAALQGQIDTLNKAIADLQAQVDAISGAPPSKTVFVTSEAYAGDLGGLAGADGKCNALASLAGLEGTYKAWLSAATGSPAADFTKESIPYRLVDGTLIAESWAGLTDGTINHPIDLDEYGLPTAAVEVWSNTREDGTVFDRSNLSTCLSWHDSSAGDIGQTGRIDQPAGEWTSFNDRTCDQLLPLYCFEQ